jgi:nitroreductase
MEGFMPAKLDELLGLEAKGLHSVLILAIGERDEATDYMVNVKKVRTPKSELYVQL